MVNETEANQLDQPSDCDVGDQSVVTSRMEMTFDSQVKHHKAVEWLMVNDPVFRVLMDRVKLSPFNAFAVIDQAGGTILAKVAEAAQRMEVTPQERELGYPLPKDDAELEYRMRTKLAAESSS